MDALAAVDVDTTSVTTKSRVRFILLTMVGASEGTVTSYKAVVNKELYFEEDML